MSRYSIPALALVGLTGCPGNGDDSASDLCTSGSICTYMGTGVAGLPVKDGCRLEEATYLVVDMTVGPDGDVYYLDWNNHEIIHILPGTTGQGVGEGCDTLHVVTGTTMLGDGPEGPAEQAAWNHPTDITFRPDGAMVFAAWHNSRVVAVDTANMVDWFVGNGKRDFTGDGGPADVAALDLPVGVEYDADGNLYVADQANQRIRRVNAADGLIETVVGTGEYGYNGDEIPALEAQLFNELSQAAAPAGKLVIRDGKMYIADTSNNRVRMVTMDDWIIHTVAGTGTAGFSGDGGAATAAQLNGPRDVELGADGTLYIADTGNNCIRALATDGTISTFAGTCGEAGFAGDGGAPTDAVLYQPFGVDADQATGAVYIADTYNNRIRVVNP